MWGLVQRLLGGAPSRGTSFALSKNAGAREGAREGDVPVLDLSSLRYIPLPRAPLQWETNQTVKNESADGAFEVREAAWSVHSVEKISPAERPDPAFRELHPTNAGVFMVDDLGKAKGLGTIKSAALRCDREGAIQAKVGFTYDIYRLGVHALGHGLAIMSRDCILHAYDDDLKQIIEVDLASVPEIAELRSRFGIPQGQLKNHLRCVALSQSGSRFLFTAVDQAFCCGSTGNRLWAARLPKKDGWERVAASSGTTNTSTDVQKAMALMDLSLPLAPEQLKTRYRELAKKWHPDLNPQDPKAGEKMGALTAAAETLTGIDASDLPQYTGATFARELSRHEIEVEGHSISFSISMQVGELYASDWIYAASFAAGSNGAYLAGYSGKVVKVTDAGAGDCVYDIGAVPSRIVDTGDYLYLLTTTRLYVLRGDELHALIDTYEAGDLIVAHKGFGLMQDKCLRWYTENGTYVGMVVTKDPIRRVYQAGGRTVIETRQQRAVIDGMPLWW